VAKLSVRDLLRADAGGGGHVNLSAIDPDSTPGIKEKKALRKLPRQHEKLFDLQERLWAEQARSVLVPLQGMDTSGKDGTVKHVMTAFNPSGCFVTSWKAPSPSELAHDYLWRIHQRTPGKGEISIFNRSHYEDVLVVRVHELVPKTVWSKRYAQINEFERTLSAEGTTILKFFLLIDRDEQKQRLQARLDDPNKHWKFRVGDLA